MDCSPPMFNETLLCESLSTNCGRAHLKFLMFLHSKVFSFFKSVYICRHLADNKVLFVHVVQTGSVDSLG